MLLLGSPRTVPGLLQQPEERAGRTLGPGQGQVPRSLGSLPGVPSGTPPEEVAWSGNKVCKQTTTLGNTEDSCAAEAPLCWHKETRKGGGKAPSRPLPRLARQLEKHPEASMGPEQGSSRGTDGCTSSRPRSPCKLHWLSGLPGVTEADGGHV